MTGEKRPTKNLTSSATTTMGVCKTDIPTSTSAQKSAAMDNTSPKLLEAWLAHQERLKHFQLAQQHQNLYQQQAAAALLRSASAEMNPAAAANPAAIMFNLYYQVQIKCIISYKLLNGQTYYNQSIYLN